MADTIITNSPEKNNGNGDGGAGWFLAVVIIIAVAVVGVILYKNGVFSKTAAPNNSTNINVTVPNGAGNTGTSGY